MEELPPDLTIDILSRLPIKTIIHCKRVCKKWRNLVLDSSFVDLHLSRTPTGLVIHQNVKYLCDGSIDPGSLKWVEKEDNVNNHHFGHGPPMSLNLNMLPVFQNSLIDQMGSVNGLICLWHCYPIDDNYYICNPITREILILPTPPQYHKQGLSITAYGFGVASLTTGEYKMVRTLQREIPLNGNKYKLVSEEAADVYTLGTGRWRSLGRAPYRLSGPYGTFLNDHCHWIVYNKEDALERICTFDLDKETFQLFPSPPTEAIQESYSRSQFLTVLKGCLCQFDGNDSQFTIWVMKEYGIKKSWHKEVVITEAIDGGLDWPLEEPISLIDGLKEGTILFVGSSLFAFCPRSNTIEAIETFDRLESGLAYRPAFLNSRILNQRRFLRSKGQQNNSSFFCILLSDF